MEGKYPFASKKRRRRDNKKGRKEEEHNKQKKKALSIGFNSIKATLSHSYSFKWVGKEVVNMEREEIVTSFYIHLSKMSTNCQKRKKDHKVYILAHAFFPFSLYNLYHLRPCLFLMLRVVRNPNVVNGFSSSTVSQKQRTHKIGACIKIYVLFDRCCGKDQNSLN